LRKTASNYVLSVKIRPTVLSVGAWKNWKKVQYIGAKTSGRIDPYFWWQISTT